MAQQFKFNIKLAFYKIHISKNILKNQINAKITLNGHLDILFYRMVKINDHVVVLYNFKEPGLSDHENPSFNCFGFYFSTFSFS